MQSRLAILLFAAAGCAHRVALFCDENTPCEDPARPFCDLAGEFPTAEGVGKTCIPNPFDAGVPDASPPPPDAATPCTPREWAPEFVDQEGDIGFHVDIAVDRDLGVHIVYHRDGPLARYAYRRAGSTTWETQTLEAGGFYPQVVTAGDRVDVVHGTLSTLRHLSRRLDESSFAKQDVISAVAYDVSLAADESGDLHVAYYNSDEAGKSPSYQRTRDNVWQLPEILMPGGPNGTGNAIGVGGGVVHLVFDVDDVNQGLKYASRSVSGEWTIQALAPDESSTYSALAADDAGAHIAYYLDGELHYALARPGTGFDRKTIEPVGDVFAFMGAATDPSGGVHLTYRDELAPRLRYAHRDASSETFLAETIETGAVGSASAVAVDVSGGIHVVYLDEAGKDVKYAYLCR